MGNLKYFRKPLTASFMNERVLVLTVMLTALTVFHIKVKRVTNNEKDDIELILYILSKI